MSGILARWPVTVRLARTTIATILALAISGCDSVRPEESFPSQVFPSIEIVCRGDGYVSPEKCRAAGERLLRTSIDFTPKTRRVIITIQAAAGSRCSGELFDDASKLLLTTSISCPR